MPLPQIGQELIGVQSHCRRERNKSKYRQAARLARRWRPPGCRSATWTSDPPVYRLGDGDQVRLTRVREEFLTEEVTIPFEQQLARNESLPVGETRLVQPGVSGAQELTYRILYEDEQEVSRSVVKSVTCARLCLRS
jgi:hypothetical protein